MNLCWMKTYGQRLLMYYSMVAYQTFFGIGRLMRNLCPGMHIVTRIVEEFELEREYWLALKHLLDGRFSAVLIETVFGYFVCPKSTIQYMLRLAYFSYSIVLTIPQGSELDIPCHIRLPLRIMK